MIVVEQKQPGPRRDWPTLLISILAILAGALTSLTRMPVIAYALIGIAALLLIVVSHHDLRKRYNRWSHSHAQNEVARRGLDDLRLFGKRFLELADPQRPNTVAYAFKEVVRFGGYGQEKVENPAGIQSPVWDGIFAELREHRLRRTNPDDFLSSWRESFQFRIPQSIEGAGEFLGLLQDFVSLVAAYTRYMVQEPIETLNKLKLNNLEAHNQDYMRQMLHLSRERYVLFLGELEGFLDRISAESGGFFPRRQFDRPPTITA